MPFTPEPTLSVEDRVRDAFIAMHLDADKYPNLFNCLYYNLEKPRLSLVVEDSRVNDDVDLRLQAIVSSVQKAQAVIRSLTPQQPLTEVLLCAIASRDLNAGGEAGFKVMRREADGAAFVKKVEAMQRGFENAMMRAFKEPLGYNALDHDTRWLLEFHSFDYVQRVMFIVSNALEPLPREKLDPMLQNVQRCRILLADVLTPLARRFKSNLVVFDQRVVRPAPTAARPVQDGMKSWKPEGSAGASDDGKVVSLASRRPKPS